MYTLQSKQYNWQYFPRTSDSLTLIQDSWWYNPWFVDQSTDYHANMLYNLGFVSATGDIAEGYQTPDKTRAGGFRRAIHSSATVAVLSL